MTTHTFPHSSGFFDDSVSPHLPADQPTVRLSDPGDLLAAIPALLGFRPERSIVALCLSGEPISMVGAVMRHDLVLGGGLVPTVPMHAALEQFSAVCGREEATGLLLVMIDDRFADPEKSSRAELASIVDELEMLLEASPTELLDVFVTTEIAEGNAWFSLLGGGGHGVQSDPVSSRVAVAQVLGGRAIRSSRDDLEAAIEAGPALERLRIAELIDAARESTHLQRDLAANSHSPDREHRRELEMVLSYVARVSSGEKLVAPEFAELALTLTDLAVRDSLLALAVGECADDAEQLWILLARNLPDPERATAAALLGYSAYVRGDGPMAGVALGAALESDPNHNLARLLDVALQSGLRPSVVRELAVVGFECAQRIGVTMPPPTDV